MIPDRHPEAASDGEKSLATASATASTTTPHRYASFAICFKSVFNLRFGKFFSVGWVHGVNSALLGEFLRFSRFCDIFF